MRRVSSRQRLVSWDAFDATASSDFDNGSPFPCYDDEEESYHSSSYETARSSFASEDVTDNHTDATENIASRRRKRDRKSLRSPDIPKTTSSSATIVVPAIIPLYSWEVGSPLVNFDNLIDDVHLDIFSFLDLSSMRTVMSLSHRYRQLMMSNDAMNSIWMGHCQNLWHIKRGKDRRHRETLPKLIDNFRLPIAASKSATGANSEKTNLSLLFSLTPKRFPTCVDENFSRTRFIRHNNVRENQRAMLPHIQGHDKLIQFYNDTSTGLPLVRYIGPIARGDRCIRSNLPLPRPSRLACLGETLLDGHHHLDSNRPFLFSLLRCGPKSMMGDSGCKDTNSSSSSSSPPFNELSPFVVPFVDQSSNDNITTVNVTPRFVSYYEVTILQLNQKEKESPTERQRTSLGSTSIECVAVGIATGSFQAHSRMPGWDRQSFGYHGDDGGIFHSSGGMLKEYGPKYGPGDTVGCGVDYISKGIFFTLNGEFLGYAWDDVDDSFLESDLFPVVGLDTNSPVHLNFGTGFDDRGDAAKFRFDLSSFINQHQGIISSTYSLEDCSVTAFNVSKQSSLRRQRRIFPLRRNSRDQK